MSKKRTWFIIFIALVLLSLAIVFYWRNETLKQTRSIQQNEQSKEVNSELRSNNYQIEVQDSSPTAQ